jgi:hypothetical protein
VYLDRPTSSDETLLNTTFRATKTAGGSQKKYTQSFLFGRQFKLLDILRDLIH